MSLFQEDQTFPGGGDKYPYDRPLLRGRHFDVRGTYIYVYILRVMVVSFVRLFVFVINGLFCCWADISLSVAKCFLCLFFHVCYQWGFVVVAVFVRCFFVCFIWRCFAVFGFVLIV